MKNIRLVYYSRATRDMSLADQKTFLKLPETIMAA